MAKSIDQSVLDVLAAGRTDGGRYYLPAEKLDRAQYTKVNTILEIAGGKWNRSAQAHLFAVDADEALDCILLTGEIEDRKKDLQQFFTPPHLADQLVTFADIKPLMAVLEPSAGDGSLARAANAVGGRVHCVELDVGLARGLVSIGFDTDQADFLSIRPGETGGMAPPLFDRIIMNPPFTRQQDVQHVMHAFRFLRPTGRLVAIVSRMAGKHNNRWGLAFTEWMIQRGRNLVIHTVPAGTFRASGTMVETKILVVQN